ncbi:MAG: cohesin domain-containing protein [Gemmatimonadales bacterium]|nr:cohesin domain-containing protein [Gemmatimonadales bacterium]
MRTSSGILLATVLFLLTVVVNPPTSAQTVYVTPSDSQPEVEEFTVDIVLGSEGHEIMGMEISISFNEHIVQLDGIDPGPWFTGLDHEWFFWDYTHPDTELIYFTGSSLGSGVTTDGVVATCRFTALGPGISTLDFLGVDLRNSQNVRLVADHSSGDSITIDSAIPTTDASWEHIKALFQ